MKNDETRHRVRHVVLLGDSIFDNGVYVPGQPAVVQQLQSAIPAEWQATLLAVDGDVTADVAQQIESLPSTATDLIVSVGGNDALRNGHLLQQVEAPSDLNSLIAEPVQSFREEYERMLNLVVAQERPVCVCTIYDQCPFDNPLWQQWVPVALESFNKVIIDVATERGVDVIELRDLCTEPGDYSSLSPIEPSCEGGQKIVDAIVGMLTRGTEAKI